MVKISERILDRIEDEEPLKGKDFNRLATAFENFVEKSELQNSMTSEILKEIKKNTEGIVTRKELENFGKELLEEVDERIATAINESKDKRYVQRWVVIGGIATAIITAAASIIVSVVKGA